MIRQLLVLIRGIGMLAAAIVLGTLAYLAYSTATPGNGQLLIAAVLGVLALLALLSIPTRAIDYELAPDRRALPDLGFPVTVRFGMGGNRSPEVPGSGPLRWSAGEGAPMTILSGEPEVHRLDLAMLGEAKRRAAEGASIDELCRMIDPAHDRHDAIHQEVFRRMVRTAIDHA